MAVPLQDYVPVSLCDYIGNFVSIMTQKEEKSTPFTENTFKEFERMISRHRLQRYRRATENKQQAVALYLWNVALSEALYPPIHFFEVAFRNAAHQALTTCTGNNPRWFMDQSVLTEDRHQKQVQDAIKELHKKRKSHFVGNVTDINYPKEPHRVVAELSLGFWINLFSNPYTNTIVSATASIVFPNGPKEVVSDKRQDIVYPRLREVLDLRNRVFHHEPIYHWTYVADDTSLMARHRRLCEVVSWMCHVQPLFLQAADRFVKVHQHGTRTFLEASEFAFLQDEERSNLDTSVVQTNKANTT